MPDKAAAREAAAEEDNLRAYYPQRVGQPAWHVWKGLALGASAEGVPYAPGRPCMRPADGSPALPPPDAYARSLGESLVHGPCRVPQ